MSWANTLSMADCNAAVADLYAFDPKTGHAYAMLILRLRKVGSIPFDDRGLAAIARCTKHFWINRAWPALQELFEVRDRRLYHPEVQGLRGMGSYPPEAETPNERRRQAAQVAANARWAGRSNLNVVQDEWHAIASESHTQSHAISNTSAYVSDAISDAGASRTASAGASGPTSDRIPDASPASDAPSLSQQRDSLREGSKNQAESLGERAPARADAPMRSDAISDATASPNASGSHAGSQTTPRPTKPQKTPIPRDWEPSLEGVAAARKKGLDPALVAANFRDWHIGHGMEQADWDARFRIWLEREQGQDVSRRQGNMPMPIETPGALENPSDTVEWLNPHDPDNPRLLDAWTAIRQGLKAEVTPGAYRSWLQPMILRGLDGDEIVITLPSLFLCDRVRSEYGPQIQARWRPAYPEAHRVDFRVNVTAGV